ncbi:MAG: hypothetical protein M3O31_02750 [Acidobacteriota bacterium]|nr:hypothetical protein [Acidobacteriota bacterium]
MKILARWAVVLTGVAMFVGMGMAQGGSRPLLLVANQTDHTLSLIDPAAGKEIAAVSGGRRDRA